MNRYFFLFFCFINSNILYAQEKTFDYFVSCFSNGCQKEDIKTQQLCSCILSDQSDIDLFNEIQKERNKTVFSCSPETCLTDAQRLAFVAFLLSQKQKKVSGKQTVVVSFGSGDLYHEALLATAYARWFNKAVLCIGIDLVYTQKEYDGLKETVRNFCEQEKGVSFLFCNSAQDYSDLVDQQDDYKYDLLVGINFEYEEPGVTVMHTLFKSLVQEGDGLVFELLCNNACPGQKERVIKY